jgi:hypothetical protein
MEACAHRSEFVCLCPFLVVRYRCTYDEWILDFAYYRHLNRKSYANDAREPFDLQLERTDVYILPRLAVLPGYEHKACASVFQSSNTSFLQLDIDSHTLRLHI